MRPLPSLEDHTRDELLRLYAAVMDTLKKRGYVRSANNPVGDLAESIVADFYGVKPGAANTAGYDLIADGKKIQVKALRLASPRPSGPPCHPCAVRTTTCSLPSSSRPT